MAKQRTDTESVLKLVINGQQAKTSVKELRDTYFKLNAEINNMKKADNPKAYTEKAAKVKQLKDAWNEARNEINGTTRNVKEFNATFQDIAKGVFGGNMLMRAWDMASRGVVNFIDRNAELSDQMAAVIKTTGLNEQAVDRLNESFKKIDTRSAKSELMGLAYVAGKLGYTLESDVEQFVRAADQIGVALGEELGGTEDAVRSIGKLVDIFKVSDSFGLEESLLKVGSIINELGQAGTANEKYLVDFTQRMAGIAPAAGISMQNIMGMAATLDELGQQLESSSTAIGQFIVKMGNDIPKFAKVAGMSVEDFAKLLKEDANEAFLRVLEASNSAGGGIQKLAENMGLINVAGARGIAALGVLSGNVDKLREKQTLSNQSFDEGTSIVQEFDRVNNTLGANLDKLKNRMAALWENSRLREWFTDVTAKMVEMTSSTDAATIAFRKQQAEIDENERLLNPLIARYVELQEKNELNNDEHEEFKEVITKIGELMPDVITEFDTYGNVIGVNIDKVRELTAAQRELLQLRKKDVIDSLKQQVRESIILSRTRSDEANFSLSGGRVRERLMLGLPGPLKSAQQLSEESKLALGDAYDAAVQLRDEFGLNLSPEVQKIIEQFEEVKKVVKEVPEEGWDELRGGSAGKEKPKRLTEAEKLAAELIKINDEIFLNSLEGFDKETEAIRLKYEKLRALAKGNKDQLLEIDRLEAEEAEVLFNKIAAAGKKAEDELQEKKKETLQKIKELGLSGAALEIEIERKKYEELIQLAQKYGIDISAIVAARETGRQAIEAKYQKRREEDEKKALELKKEREREIRDFAIDSSKMVADAIFQIGENNRRAKYDKEHNDLEEARRKELASKNLTEAQKEAINTKYDAKAKELKRKEFQDNKRAAIAEAFINMALGIGRAIPNPFKMAFAGAAGLAQIAVISSQKPHFAKGGILPRGSSHAQGGIDLWDQRRQQIIGNIEGGEPILSKATYANNKEIVDQLLYSSQRKAGARIQLNPEVLDAERMVRNGGYTMASGQKAPVVNVSSPATDFTPMGRKMDEMINVLKDFKEIEVYLSTRALEDHNRKMAKLKGDINA